MDYYRYLGVEPSASPEEIHAAYRRLALLLHPDRQGEAALRRVAEEQLRHLNAVLEVLADPVRRKAYDGSLSGAGRRCAAVRLRSRAALRKASVGMAAGAVLGWWIFRQDPASGTLRVARPPAAAPAALATPARPMPRAAPAGASRRGRSKPVRRLAAPPAGSGIAEPGLPEPPRLAAALGQLPEPPPSSPPAVPPRFAGTWFYVREAGGGGAPYPPEYIEATIVEDGALVRGRYRGVYRVRDRTISSEVAFEFTGVVEAQTARLEWTGPGRRRGQAFLRMLSGDSLEMSWWDASPGSSPGLGSGTALLVRRNAP